MPTRPADSRTPRYMLTALGYGRLATTFFLLLYKWIPHPNPPAPTFNSIAASWSAGTPLQQSMIAAALAGLAITALLHFRAMAWNLGRYAAFRKTQAHEKLRNSNAGSQLLGLPLMQAMTVNVTSTAGLAFVPCL